MYVQCVHTTCKYQQCILMIDLLISFTLARKSLIKRSHLIIGSTHRQMQQQQNSLGINIIKEHQIQQWHETKVVRKHSCNLALMFVQQPLARSLTRHTYRETIPDTDGREEPRKIDGPGTLEVMLVGQQVQRIPEFRAERQCGGSSLNSFKNILLQCCYNKRCDNIFFLLNYDHNIFSLLNCDHLYQMQSSSH